MEEDEIKELEEAIKTAIRRHGSPVHMGTEYCKKWKKDHFNCLGCESSLGCVKMAYSLALMQNFGARYKSQILKLKTDKEFQETIEQFKILKDKILNAKSREEIEREIPIIYQIFPGEDI